MSDCCNTSNRRTNQPQARVNNGAEGAEIDSSVEPQVIDLPTEDYRSSVGHTPTTSLQIQVGGLYIISASADFSGDGTHRAEIYSSTQGVLTSEYAETGEDPSFSLATQARLVTGELISLRGQVEGAEDPNNVIAHLELVRVSPLT